MDWVLIAMFAAPVAFWWCCCGRCPCCKPGKYPDAYQADFSGWTAYNGTGGLANLNGYSTICRAWNLGSDQACVWRGVFPYPLQQGQQFQVYLIIAQVCGFYKPDPNTVADFGLLIHHDAAGFEQFTPTTMGTVVSSERKRDCKLTYTVSCILQYASGFLILYDTGTVTLTPIDL